MKLHEVWLPFSEGAVNKHFFDHEKTKTTSARLKNIFRALKDYSVYETSIHDAKQSARKLNRLCRIQMDERIWTMSTMMNLYHNENRIELLSSVFQKAFLSEQPPIDGISRWEDCFSDGLELRFEVSIPSPRSYNTWLEENSEKCQIIPYVLEAKHRMNHREIHSTIDAVLYNPDINFAALIEAKLLADLSVDTINDVCRNQMARNIDVMLESDDGKLNRIPERTVIMLVTPEITKMDPTSRLYGYKYIDYKNDADNIRNDLPHRKDDVRLQNVGKRLGWTTWEECHRMSIKCCPWLTR